MFCKAHPTKNLKYVHLLVLLKMVNMTLAVPEELQKIIRKHKDVKWSEVARRAMWEKATQLELMDKIVSKSKLTEKDVMEIDKKIKRGLAQRYKLL